MNYFFSFKPIEQAPDSTQSQSSQSLMQQNEQGFMQQESIMSSAFENKSIDSIVKVNTQKLRIHKKKTIEAYKHIESYLIVKKDSFLFLRNIQNPKYKIFDVETYQYQTILNLMEVNNNQDITPVKEAPVLIISDSSVIVENKIIDSNFDSSILEETSSTKELTVSPVEEIEVITEAHTSQEAETINAISPKDKPSLSNDIWLMGILLFILFLSAFLKFHFNSKLKTYYQSIFSFQLFSKMFKEQNTTNRRLAFFLSFIFYTNISLLIYYSINPVFQKGFYTLASIFLIIFGIFLIFTTLNKLIAFVFESYNLVNEYLYNLFFFNRILGLSLLPLVVFYPYISHFGDVILFFLAWPIVFLSFILRWFRGLKISFKYRVSYFYMFLYLCTLEIIPLLFIIKMILR